MAVAIMGIISYALTESVIQALRTTDGTTFRYAESLDAQTLAVSFVTDIQGSESVEAPAAQGGDCAGSTTPLLRVERTDSGVQKMATYTLEAPSAVERHLIRRYCEKDLKTTGPANPLAFVLVREHVVANFVAPAGPDPTLTCAPGPCGAHPRTVTMSVTDESGYVYQLTGSRRTP